MCCNKIRKVDQNSFKNAHKLETMNLSSNLIESIHPRVSNRKIVTHLDLSSNMFSSLETTKIVNDEYFHLKNRTKSFLDTIQSTLVTLSLENSTNLLEFNWFVLTKLKRIIDFETFRNIKDRQILDV